jgi:hemerythrin superfamily protein
MSKAPASSKSRSQSGDLTDLIKQDHRRVRELFKQFEKTEDDQEKQKIVDETILELKVHAKLEEELVYPALREASEEEDMMDEADEEHHVVKLLIAELEDMESGDDHFDAKFRVLGEMVEHHVAEEESQMLPNVKKIEDRESLVESVLQRKEELMREMEVGAE